MNLDQTAPEGAVWSGFILFAIKVIKINKNKKNSQKLFSLSNKIIIPAIMIPIDQSQYWR